MSTSATLHACDDRPQTREGCDANGRFAKGNRGGPGNPFARKVALLRQTLLSFVTEEDMKEIAFILLQLAKRGDLAAIKLLFQYVLGKPAETVDPDRLDVDEWQVLQEHARTPTEIKEVLDRLPAHLMTEMTRISWPCAVAEGFAEPLAEGLHQDQERQAERRAKQEERAAKAAASGGDGRPAEPTANGPNGAAASLTADGEPEGAGDGPARWVWPDERGRGGVPLPNGGNGQALSDTPPSPNGDDGPDGEAAGPD